MIGRVVLATVVFLYWNGSPTAAEERILGGIVLDFHELPFMASIQAIPKNGAKRSTLCTASVIGDRYILTAAHCFYDVYEQGDVNENKKKFKQTFEVQLGALNKNEGQFIRISDLFFLPRKPNSDEIYDDIMVVQLKDRVKLDDENVRRIKLPKKVELNPGLVLNVAGFGNHTLDGKTFDIPDTYTTNQVVVKDNLHCYFQCNDHEFCAGDKMQGTLSGDSGGPIYIGNGDYQVGVVNRGRVTRGRSGDDGDLVDHGVYAKVSHYCNYIAKVTKHEVKCEDMVLNEE